METPKRTVRKVKVVRPSTQQSSDVQLFAGLSSSTKASQANPPQVLGESKSTVQPLESRPKSTLLPIPASVALRTTEQPTPSTPQTSLSRIQPPPPSLEVQPPPPLSSEVQPPPPLSSVVQPPPPPSQTLSQLNPQAPEFVPPPPTTSYDPSCRQIFDLEKAYAEISALDDPMDKMEYREGLCKYDRRLLQNREAQELVVLPLPKEKGEFSPKTPTDSPPKNYSVHSKPFTQYKKVDGRYYTATEAEQIKNKTTLKKKTGKQIQQEKEEREEYLKKIHLTNFPKKTIIRPSNKFNALLNVGFDTERASLTSGILSSFNESKKQNFSPELNPIHIQEYEDCTSDICRLWDKNQYLDILSGEGKKEVKFIEGNIYLTLKHDGTQKTLKISKYNDLNSYLKKLRKRINREFLENPESTQSKNLDKKLEIIYTALHKILSYKTNILNRADSVNEILINLYMSRKSSYLKENKDEWKKISETYFSQQKELNKYDIDNKAVIEHPIALLNDKFYVILQNPQIV